MLKSRGTDLATELRKAMDRLASVGMPYRSGYYEMLVAKYSTSGIRYPRILTRIGEPRIRKHPAYYQAVIQPRAMLLDYGCGTGCDVRAVLVDGHPRDKVIGFDVVNDLVELGFDLYLDKDRMNGIFVVSQTFPFEESKFDTVYSGGVLQAIGKRQEVQRYIRNAYTSLRQGGVFFGSTLGIDNPAIRGADDPRTVLSENEAREFLEEAGFGCIEVRKAYLNDDNPKYRLVFSGRK